MRDLLLGLAARRLALASLTRRLVLGRRGGHLIDYLSLFGQAGLLGVERIEICLSLFFKAGRVIYLAVCLRDRGFVQVTAVFEPGFRLGDLVARLAHLIELSPLLHEQTYPKLEAVSEVGEVLGPDQNVNEANVAALVHLRCPLLELALSLCEILLGRRKRTRCRCDLALQLAQL